VVDHHVFGAKQAERIVFVAGRLAARPYPQVAANDVRRIGERDFSATKADTAARRRFPRTILVAFLGKMTVSAPSAWRHTPWHD
jgi:hypothetical protein